MNRLRLIGLVVAAALMFPVGAKAQLNVIGHYTGGNTTLDIATFTKKDDRVGIMGISRKVSIAFAPGEFKHLVALWRKARKVRSDSFQFVGTYKETQTTYNSLLTVSAGPGIQFTVNDKPGTYTFTMSPSDYARFDADLARVNAYINPN